MPNASNITAPFLVAGAGRTGSSYVLHILRMRGDTQALIENTVVMSLRDMVLKSWWSPAWRFECSEEELHHRIIRLARQAMITLFPSDRPYWAYKAIWELMDWDLYEEVYPDARYIHLVRDPRTNIASMMDFIGRDHGKAHWTFDHCCKKYVESNLKALELQSREVPYLLVRQEDFIDRPEATWARIFRFLDLPLMELDYSVEVNTASTTRGKVREKRAKSAPRWEDLPAEVQSLARELGYRP